MQKQHSYEIICIHIKLPQKFLLIYYSVYTYLGAHLFRGPGTSVPPAPQGPGLAARWTGGGGGRRRGGGREGEELRRRRGGREGEARRRVEKKGDREFGTGAGAWSGEGDSGD